MSSVCLWISVPSNNLSPLDQARKDGQSIDVLLELKQPGDNKQGDLSVTGNMLLKT